MAPSINLSIDLQGRCVGLGLQQSRYNKRSTFSRRKGTVAAAWQSTGAQEYEHPVYGNCSLHVQDDASGQQFAVSIQPAPSEAQQQPLACFEYPYASEYSMESFTHAAAARNLSPTSRKAAQQPTPFVPHNLAPSSINDLVLFEWEYPLEAQHTPVEQTVEH